MYFDESYLKIVFTILFIYKIGCKNGFTIAVSKNVNSRTEPLVHKYYPDLIISSVLQPEVINNRKYYLNIRILCNNQTVGTSFFERFENIIRHKK